MSQEICYGILRRLKISLPPEIVFARVKKFQFLRKLLNVIITFLFLTGLLYPGIINARQSVGILSINIDYPSRGFNWLKLFLKEELSLQLQLADRFSVISPNTMDRWNQRYNEKVLFQMIA